MKKYVAALARGVADAGKRYGQTLFASIWADAIEQLSVVSEWGQALPWAAGRRHQALQAAWVAYQATTVDKDRYQALVRLMAAASWAAVPLIDRQGNN